MKDKTIHTCKCRTRFDPSKREKNVKVTFWGYKIYVMCPGCKKKLTLERLYKSVTCMCKCGTQINTRKRDVHKEDNVWGNRVFYVLCPRCERKNILTQIPK